MLESVFQLEYRTYNKVNKAIGLLFQKETLSKPCVIFYRVIGNIHSRKVWVWPNKYLITNKMKGISFKILQ